MGFCPFHPNSNDPAFEVDKRSGLFCCFNPACAAAGTLEQLATRIKEVNTFEFARLIIDHRQSSYDMMVKMRETPVADFVPFPEEPVQRMGEELWASPPAIDYLHGRGFNDETLKHFGVGYSQKQDMIITPMHDPKGVLIGFIGRSIEGKVFKNSLHLPKSKSAWNFHRAKLTGDTVIVVESNFDAMRIHQAGYPNVIALLGGSLSRWHIEQLDRTFSTIIIMTDFDLYFEGTQWCKKCKGKCQGHRPGRALGWSIVEALPYKKVKWAVWDDLDVYPDNKKDATELTDDQIRSMLLRPVNSLMYRELDFDRVELVQ